MRTIIIGGVAAGMSTAARLRRLDEYAEIIVLERGQHVSFANCGLPYHIGAVIEHREALLLQTPASLAESLNLDVRIGHTVLAIDVNQKSIKIHSAVDQLEYQISYDYLVITTGAAPVVPALPGIHHPAIRTLRNIEDMDHIKLLLTDRVKHVVVIGGGFIGIEMAENLVQIGRQVTLIERNDQIMASLDKEMATDLEYCLQQHAIHLKKNTAVCAFEDTGARLSVVLQSTCQSSVQTGGETIEADLVILSIGVRPEIDLVRSTPIALGPNGGILVDKHMQTSVKDVYAAGDAVEVPDAVTHTANLIPLAGPANRQGRVIADNIAGIPSRYLSTQGTAIVKVFERVAASTGANEKTLQRYNIPYHKVYLHPAGHASYYPGSRVMHMKLLFSPNHGTLLGAQIVGYDGVDKRIDVLATALKAKLTVYDLQELELAYAPPFGSAKDAVNMAGFVASNFLQGRVAFWYAESFNEIPLSGLIVDVRGVSEYASGHIPGAVNIPLAVLRRQTDVLPKDRPIYLYCHVGLRSYMAYRLLRQRQFLQLQTLAGGYKTFVNYHGGG